MDEIWGPRVRLVVMPVEVLERAAAAQQVARARHGAGIDGEEAEPDAVDWPGVGPISGELVAGVPAGMRLEQLADEPELRAQLMEWLVRGIVVDDPTTPTGRRVIGHLGGHGLPDERGVVEIGYTVAAADRRQGYAVEGARAWFDWAHSRGAAGARLSTTPDNLASRAIARNLGLVEVGGQWDEGDQCWELVHEGPLPLPGRKAPDT